MNKAAEVLGFFVLMLGLVLRAWGGTLGNQCRQSAPYLESCPSLTVVGSDLSIAFLLIGSIPLIWALAGRYRIRAHTRIKAVQRVLVASSLIRFA